jgi:hypothetical protein
VLADDLAGTVHRRYGSMSDPVYLLDVDGRVVFYGMWIDGPRLRRAIEALLAQGGRGGPVAGGIDRWPHLAPAIVEGWRTLRRGGTQAVLDFARAFPPLAPLVFIGYLARPVLRPLVVRSRPLPKVARLALWVSAGVPLLAAWWRRAARK